MALSVYRQRSPLAPMELADAYRIATTSDDVELIGMAMRFGKPVLIGLADQMAVIKQAAEGDEAHSFESLFDVALTVVDLKKMQAANVKDPRNVPMPVYHVEFAVPSIDVTMTVHCEIPANDQATLRARIKEFAQNSGDFNAQFLEAVVTAYRRELLDSFQDVFYGFKNATLIGATIEEEATEATPPWKFVSGK